MRPIRYHDAVSHRWNPYHLRRELVQAVLREGISVAARSFRTTRKTVRKWVCRIAVLLAKSYAYQLWFNFLRPNLRRRSRAPADILAAAGQPVALPAFVLSPLLLDDLIPGFCPGPWPEGGYLVPYSYTRVSSLMRNEGWAASVCRRPRSSAYTELMAPQTCSRIRLTQDVKAGHHHPGLTPGKRHSSQVLR